MERNLLYLLHQNDKGEWGMWKEYYKNGTAVYWEAACEGQVELIKWYQTRTDVRAKHRQKIFDKYIKDLKKSAERAAPEPIRFYL